MANFYYNAGTWYSDDQFTTEVDISTITAGDAVYGQLNGDNGEFINGVNFSGVDLSNLTKIGRSSIEGSNCSGAIFPNDLSGWVFDAVNFNGVDFSNVTTMAGTQFNTSTLVGTIFPSDISGVDFFGGLNLAGTDFSNVIFSNDASYGEDFSLAGTILPNKGFLNNVYYINAVATTLDSSGSGFWSDKAYYYGTDQPTGFNGYHYYINDVETNLDSSGNGDWNGNHYSYGSVLTDGFDAYANLYYIGGQATTLDSSGNGYWNSLLYSNGALFSGYLQSNEDYSLNAYYIEGVETTLNSSGNGTWNGQTYVNGVVQGGGGGSVNLESGLQAFYKLSDTSDSSGNNRTLTNNGNVSFASGKIGDAAVFDGSNWLNASINQTGITDYTLACWVKLDVNSSGPQFLINGLTGNAWQNGGITLDLQDKFPITYVNFGGDGLGYGLNSQTELATDTWYHLVGVRSNGLLKIYINGSVDCVSETTDNTPIPGGSPVSLGQNADGTYGPFTGSMDAVGIWNRALSDAEVAELYNNGTGLELGTTPTLNTLTKIQGNAKFYGKVKFGV